MTQRLLARILYIAFWPVWKLAEYLFNALTGFDHKD